MIGNGRKLWYITGAIALALALGAAPAAAVTWNPGNAARVINKPRGCNAVMAYWDAGATACTTGNMWLQGTPSIAVARDSSTSTTWTYAAWATDNPPGNEDWVDECNFGYCLVSYDDDCATVTGIDPMNHPANDPNADGMTDDRITPFCAGIYFSRSNNMPTGTGTGTWSTPIRISQSTGGSETLHSDRHAMDAYGQYVYVIYVTTIGYYSKACSNDDRPLYVRVSSDYGATFGSPILLSPSTTSLTDYPSIDAQPNVVGPAGSPPRVHVSYTDQQTGEIKVLTTTDNFATVMSRTVGYTTSHYESSYDGSNTTCSPNTGPLDFPGEVQLEGFSGFPVVAGTGTHAIAAWYANDAGQIKAKISTDGGNTWGSGGGGTGVTGIAPSGGKGPEHDGTTASCFSFDVIPENPGACTASVVDVAAAGSGATSRLGVVYGNSDAPSTTRPSGIWYRQWTAGGGWEPRRLIACTQTTTPCSGAAGLIAQNNEDAYGPNVEMVGTNGIGVVFSTCWRTSVTPENGGPPCSEDGAYGAMGVFAGDPGAQVFYKESMNGGVNWGGEWDVSASHNVRVAANQVVGADNCETAYSHPCSPVNDYPTLTFDNLSDTTVGCTQVGGAGTRLSDGCSKIVYFIGRAWGYVGIDDPDVMSAAECTACYRNYITIGTEP